MKVLIANKAGFCFGVQRAVDIAMKKTEEIAPIYSYGQLIHNDQVTNRLKEMGLENIDSLDVNKGSVIIRSHGIGKDFYTEAQNKGFDIIDCTCPYVMKVHKIVKKAYDAGETIIIIGDEKHPEIIGINGWCNNSAIISKDYESLPELNDKKYTVVAQTTLNIKKWEIIEEAFKDNDQFTLNNTICSATYERQEAAIELAKKVDCMIVIGGFHSSNTNKLYEICSKLCDNTIHIEKKSDLDLTNVTTCGIIGITAGASTPDWIIQEIYDYLVQE